MHRSNSWKNPMNRYLPNYYRMALDFAAIAVCVLLVATLLSIPIVAAP